MIVYTFDPLTLTPNGQSRVQICPRTGNTLRPPHCLNTPPPVYPECIVVRAGEDGWITDLVASKSAAISRVDKMHAEALRYLTGRATPEERDTWAPKVTAAQAIINGNDTPAQAMMIGLEAKERGISDAELSQRVLKNAGDFEMLCGLAAAFRVKARFAITTAPDVDTLAAVFVNLNTEMQKTISVSQK